MSLYIKQFFAIALNAFKVLIGDPLFFIMYLFMLGGTLLIAALPGFTLGGQLHLVIEQILALVFLSGAFLTVISATKVIGDDLLQGMIATILSRPVSGSVLLFGKWAGIVMANAFFLFTAIIAALWATRLVKIEHTVEFLGMAVYLAITFMALLLGVFYHYFKGGNFFKFVNILLFILLTVGFGVLNFWGYNGDSNTYGALIDWSAVPSFIYIFMALNILAAILVTCSVLFDITMVLVAGCVIFFFGLFSDFFLGLLFTQSSFLRAGFALFFPDWQMFWVPVVKDPATFHSFVFFISHLFHFLFQSCFFIIIAVMFFDKHEIKDI
jgi:ABC-type transport system involved in multi-copper enzyme maturation permease subunit